MINQLPLARGQPAWGDAGGAEPLRWATSHARTVLLQACGASATDAVAGAGSSPLQVEASPALLAVLELLPELDYML